MTKDKTISTVEYIKDPATGNLLAFVVRSSFRGEKYNFLTPGEYPLQLGINHYRAGEKIQPHSHPSLERRILQSQECLFIRKGKLRFVVFNSGRRPVAETVLYKNDIAFLLEGGHGFEILEDTDIVEVKQGPYGGDQDKVRFNWQSP